MHYYVQQIRIAQGLSLRRLEELLAISPGVKARGLSRARLSMLERSRAVYDHPALVRLAQVLGVRLDDLWSLEPKAPCPTGQVGWVCACGIRALWCTCGGWHAWEQTETCVVCTATHGQSRARKGKTP